MLFLSVVNGQNTRLRIIWPLYLYYLYITIPNVFFFFLTLTYTCSRYCDKKSESISCRPQIVDMWVCLRRQVPWIYRYLFYTTVTSTNVNLLRTHSPKIVGIILKISCRIYKRRSYKISVVKKRKKIISRFDIATSKCHHTYIILLLHLGYDLMLTTIINVPTLNGNI